MAIPETVTAAGVDRTGSWYVPSSAPDRRGTKGKEAIVGLVVLLLLLALLFGGLGLFVEGLKWALIIALVLLVASAISGAMGRRV